jgi:hypothetical protein
MVVDELHRLILNRNLLWGREGSRERDGGGDLTSVQYKPVWNCLIESPLVQQIYPNKK